MMLQAQRYEWMSCGLQIGDNFLRIDPLVMKATEVACER